ncbi:MAG: hypothetical protein SX243_02495 [Acidobacteriota bacterium]|nr:hypothetical protein [Acidobacteriota bacterium]
MKTKTKEALQEALFEAGFVVLGVVLALAANEWRQSRADAAQAEAALATMVQELEGNRQLVADSLAYHEELLAMIQGEHEEGWEPSPRNFPRGFIYPAQLQQTAWSTANATGALTHMDYAVVVELSGVYQAQELYRWQSSSAGELVYEALFKEGIDAIAANYRNLGTVLSTFRYREQALLELYDRTLVNLQQASG